MHAFMQYQIKTKRMHTNKHIVIIISSKNMKYNKQLVNVISISVMILALSLLIKQNDSDCVRHIRTLRVYVWFFIQTNFRENMYKCWMNMNRKHSRYIMIKRLVYHLGRKTNEMKSCYSVVMVENSNSRI